MDAEKFGYDDLTLDELLTGPHSSCVIWRLLRGWPEPLSVVRVFQLMQERYPEKARSYNGTRTIMGRLISRGWVQPLTPVTIAGRCVPVYRALEEPRIPEKQRRLTVRELANRLHRQRGNLTRLADLARRARYSTVGAEMGSALLTIEKELRELRNQIVGPGYRVTDENHESMGEHGDGIEE